MRVSHRTDNRQPNAMVWEGRVVLGKRERINDPGNPLTRWSSLRFFSLAEHVSADLLPYRTGSTPAQTLISLFL